MKKPELYLGTALAALVATPAFAQDEAEAPSMAENVIIVTAQRQAQSLQEVPIAVSAFSAEALEEQQIENSSDLQLTLPNITYTKTNFTSSSFTIRGIGDLCVGVSCDTATGIHVNDMPLLASRLFETEFFDLERIEVLRGPQGTLFGRNATSGVVNVITAKPDLSGFSASGDFEYGNFNSIKAKGMVNIPIGETLGVRLAGFYLNRDGFTKNLTTGNDIDGRDLYAIRGTLTWEPTADTKVTLMGYYFEEDDNRSRIQKQLCHRDPTGVLGCLPDRLDYDVLNSNATLAGVLSSNELLGIAVAPSFAPLGLNSLYGTDAFSTAQNPRDLRTVAIDYEPTYFAREEIYMAKLEQRLGSMTLNLTGGYSKNRVDSTVDYNLSVQDSLANNAGLLALQAYANTPGFDAIFGPVANALIPNGPAGAACQSATDPNGVGVFGGNSAGCFETSLNFDRSEQDQEQWSIEAHLDSDWDGPFNMLLGGIYLDGKTKDNSYYVNSFGLDYAAGILGAAVTASGATGGLPVYRITPFYRNNSPLMHLKSYGFFGEAYFEATDRLKLTVGLRYNHDEKFLRARTLLYSDGTSSEFSGGAAIIAPYSATTFTDALNYATADFDKATPGVQEWQERSVSFNRMTGRAVVDYELSPDNLLYASYSRGYKSGGINPPLSVGAVNESFAPEKVDAFEIGSKNVFANGKMTLNLTGFYYKYKGLQLSRIISRTSVNDNVDANIWGIEAEAIIAPIPDFVINMNASYLNTEVSATKLLINPRDVSAGRSDTVIIKDISLASNCAVTSTVGSAAAANGYVAAINGGVGLQAPVPIPSTNTTGAFSFCQALFDNAPTVGALFGGIEVTSGVPVDIKGNKLPQAPDFKFSVGAQYTWWLGDLSLVPRLDLTYTGESYGSIFNDQINRIKGYEILNAQIQLNGKDDRWYVRGFIQNITNNDATTGLYVTDQSSGLFTNIFTLDPRRYGVAVGVKF
ncbi:TonB-dependent receptor [Altererythrobacter sp.]|uniref:TonB-dependent receptor n=1 Tax=Altererythrobacter sp. TaxID=1872480 RepID=UPI003CFCB3BA